MKKVRNIVADRLKEARGGLTQTLVAKTLGISQAVLSKIESGSREPTAAELSNFASLYKKPIAYFFEESTEPVAAALKAFFKENARSLNIGMAFLCGSFARGLPNERSDIDIAVIFDTDGMADEKMFEVISEISFDLSNRFGREVNIIAVKTGNWKPMLYYNIIVLGELLFAKDRDEYLSARWEAIRQMEDFVAMGLAWQMAAARANEFIMREMAEFDRDYAGKSWEEYNRDPKLQKLMERTVENILTALIEVAGTLLAAKGIAAENYAEVMKEAGRFFKLSESESLDLAKLAAQRNRLAHRYLDLKWQVIIAYKQKRPLVRKLLEHVLAK